MKKHFSANVCSSVLTNICLTNAERRESKENFAEPKHEQNLVKERRKIENELLGICEQLIRLINNFLIPNASDKEGVEF
ncbi:14-3-3 protein [Ditylenchus destructor]|nr:14-3-3 protein [Ditylenchus destructor]